jgi:hypothetical protein
MTAVPYGFTDGYDFYDTKVYLDDLYTEDFNRIGIQSIYAGGGEERRSEISWFTLRDYDDEGIDPASEVVPDDPIDIQTAELPYSNDFSDQQKSELVVLDANGDGNTWGFSAGVAFYSYSESKAANDWLVTPRLPLKAGSKYRVSLKAAAQSSSYPEKFEVKAAKGTADTAATMAALLSAGTTVIPATTVSNYTFSTFENESFTVAEDDYYNIGIHVISPALRWVFTVKDFLVEETDAAGVYTMPHAPSTMPNEVYDLQGRRVSGAVANSSFFTLHSSLKKGLYIVNRKKVVLK